MFGLPALWLLSEVTSLGTPRDTTVSPARLQAPGLSLLGSLAQALNSDTKDLLSSCLGSLCGDRKAAATPTSHRHASPSMRKEGHFRKVSQTNGLFGPEAPPRAGVPRPQWRGAECRLVSELISLVRGILDTGARRPREPRPTPRLRGRTRLVELKQLSPPLQLGRSSPLKPRTLQAAGQVGCWGYVSTDTPSAGWVTLALLLEIILRRCPDMQKTGCQQGRSFWISLSLQTHGNDLNKVGWLVESV